MVSAFAGKITSRPEIGKLVVPIIPDEAPTSAWKLFSVRSVLSSVGQLYEPVDMDTLLYYKEAKDGQISGRGYRTGSMSSFIAAGTATPITESIRSRFFIYYSMFGFQRIGDLIWAADMRCHGSWSVARQTHHSAGEGLQHQDATAMSWLCRFPIFCL